MQININTTLVLKFTLDAKIKLNLLNKIIIIQQLLVYQCQQVLTLSLYYNCHLENVLKNHQPHDLFMFFKTNYSILKKNPLGRNIGKGTYKTLKN